ncbi:MAG: hypothetical protein WEA75_09325 [Acidimicrobiia bacterium]
MKRVRYADGRADSADRLAGHEHPHPRAEPGCVVGRGREVLGVGRDAQVPKPAVHLGPTGSVKPGGDAVADPLQDRDVAGQN